jgi:CheY-like chemotaxis protein
MMNLLRQITQTIGERRDLHSTFQVVVDTLEQHLPLDLCFICTYETATELLKVTCCGTRNPSIVTAAQIRDAVPIPLDRVGLARCLLGELIYEPDVRSAPFAFEWLAHAGLAAVAIAPLIVQKRVSGILVAARGEPGSFSSADCEFLQQVSALLALAANQVEVCASMQRAYDDLQQTQRTVFQQERLRSLDQLARGIAHDINNAIAPVALYTEALLETQTGLDEPGRHQLGVIRQAVRNVASTVSRMRELNRPRTAQADLQRIEIQGTGPGLATVCGTLERYSGKLETFRVPGKGTTICMTLPGAPGEMTIEPAKTVGQAVPPLRILLVDDDPWVLESVGSVLREEGHFVAKAAGGQAGIDTFFRAQGTPDPFAAVITDLSMPGVDGRRVATVIRAASPAVRIVMLTGWGDGLDAQSDRPAGVNHVLSKPPKLHELRSALTGIDSIVQSGALT